MESNLIGRKHGVCALTMMGAGSWERVEIEGDWIWNWRVGQELRFWETLNLGPDGGKGGIQINSDRCSGHMAGGL